MRCDCSPLQADTVEAALLECLFMIAFLERQPGRSTLDSRAVTWQLQPGSQGAEADRHIFTANVTLPVSQVLDNGRPELSVRTFLTDLTGVQIGTEYTNWTWNPLPPDQNQNETFKAQTIEQMLLEILTFCQNAEQGPGNLNQRDNVTLAWDSGTRAVTATVRVPVAWKQEYWGPAFTAMQWLGPLSTYAPSY